MKRTSILVPLLSFLVGCVGGEPPLLPPGDAGGGGGAGGTGPGTGTPGRGGPLPGGGDSGGAAGGPAACRPEDCKNAPVRDIACADGTTPSFTCARLTSGECGWTNPTCPDRKDAGADAPAREDASRPADGGPGGASCGSVTCGPGTVCCNASCGICTPPGGACTQIACVPDGGTGTTPPGACRSDSDCRLFEDYCTGCDCRALGKGDLDPKCAGPGVRCLRPPCEGKRAVCEAGKCVVATAGAGGARWYLGCGDPVCSGWTPRPDVPRCTAAQQAGTACTEPQKPCDPGNSCNSLLVCATSDPMKRPGGCPISRRETKRDVHYLAPDELRRYHDELLQMKLATWRYKHDPGRERLGFIIDDLEGKTSRTVAVEQAGNMVDLYGYTSLAVATLQEQARELRALRAELAALRRQMKQLQRTPGR